MTLKTCSCGKVNTTKTAKFITRWEVGLKAMLLFNCPHCGSTFTLFSKKYTQGKVVQNAIR